MPQSGKIRWACALFTQVFLLAAAAHAQSDGDGEKERFGELEEIVVTAGKRGAQSAQDLPAAVQAFGAKAIEATGAVEFSDIAGFVPGLVFQDSGPGDREYILRGVNSRGTATTGVYFDEAVITGSNKQDGGGRQADIELHDIERIEILKGPQGTLYGASSMSGTIRVIPAAPDTQQAATRTHFSFSNVDEGDTGYRVSGMINWPVVRDRFALRAVGWITRDGGFVDNIRLGLEDINGNEVEGLRLAARLEASENLVVTAVFLHQKRDVGGSSRYNKGALASHYEARLRAQDPSEYPILPVSDLSNQDFTINDWNEEMELWSIKAEYDWEFGNFLFTTNYFTRDIDFRFDSTPILLSFNFPTKALTWQPQRRDLWSSEVRFASDLGGPFEFVIGGFYMEEKADFETRVIAVTDAGIPRGSWDPSSGDAIFGREKHNDFPQFAFFGEGTYDITDSLQAVLGVRYYEAEVQSVARETRPFSGFPPTPIPILQSPGESQGETSYKLGVNYRLFDGALIYAEATSGFRIGGTNENAITPGNLVSGTVPFTYDSDSLWNYELGWKTTWAGGRVNWNGALYVIRWDDLQIGNFNPSSPFPYVQNGGEAGIDGVEIELNARPLTGLDLFLGASYQDARLLEDFPAGDSLGRKGDEIPNVPSFQISGSVQYRWAVKSLVNGVIRLDGVYQGSRNTLFRTGDPLNTPLDSYFLINASIAFEGNNWRWSLFANNLGDERADIDAVNSNQDPLAFITVRPRSFGIGISYSF